MYSFKYSKARLLVCWSSLPKHNGRKSYWEGGDNVILDVSLSLLLAQVKL